MTPTQQLLCTAALVLGAVAVSTFSQWVERGPVAAQTKECRQSRTGSQFPAWKDVSADRGPSLGVAVVIVAGVAE